MLASVGIGYAQFTSSITATANVTAGTFSLHWSTAGTQSSGVLSSNDGTCTVAGGGTTALTITIAGINDGESCTVTTQVDDGGNLPGNLSVTPTTGGTLGPYLSQTNTIPGTIAANGNTGLVTIGITLSGTPNGYQGATGSITLTVSATAT